MLQRMARVDDQPIFGGVVAGVGMRPGALPLRISHPVEDLGGGAAGGLECFE